MTLDRWRQIEDLYHAAQKCDPDQRAVLLECSDPEIRSRVEKMLAVGSDDQLFDRPVADFLDELPDASLELGGQLGPYKIEHGIGAEGWARYLKP